MLRLQICNAQDSRAGRKKEGSEANSGANSHNFDISTEGKVLLNYLTLIGGKIVL